MPQSINAILLYYYVFQLLEENLVPLVKKEMKRFQRLLTTDYPECLESQREEGEVVDGEDEEERRSITEGALKITLHLLRSLKQEELADILEMSKKVFLIQHDGGK